MEDRGDARGGGCVVSPTEWVGLVLGVLGWGFILGCYAGRWWHRRQLREYLRHHALAHWSEQTFREHVCRPLLGTTHPEHLPPQERTTLSEFAALVAQKVGAPPPEGTL